MEQKTGAQLTALETYIYVEQVMESVFLVGKLAVFVVVAHHVDEENLLCDAQGNRHGDWGESLVGALEIHLFDGLEEIFVVELVRVVYDVGKLLDEDSTKLLFFSPKTEYHSNAPQNNRSTKNGI